MLKVQEYLLSGKTLEDLENEHGVFNTRHEDLIILNYDQIKSIKTNPIVRECRALVLNVNDYSLVARSFPRFFNWGEVQEEMKLFDFSSFDTYTKEDGSLALLYYYNGKWRANTRGSFGLDKMQWQDFTWHEAMCLAMGISNLQELDKHLDRNLSYVCEFCSPWNKCVRKYEVPRMIHLTTFRGEEELPYYTEKKLERVEMHHFNSIEQIEQFLLDIAKKDATFEGLVMRDANYRWKCKSASYVSLHKMRGNNGENMFRPDVLVPLILAGERDETLNYFPEVAEAYEKYERFVHKEYANLMEVWEKYKGIENQKDFALAIQGKTRFGSLLFAARKNKVELGSLWEKSADLICKHL